MRNDSKTNWMLKSVHDDIKKQLDKEFEEKLETTDEKEIAGWFLGTRGENFGEAAEIILATLKKMVEDRELLYPDDPNYITPSIKLSDGYKVGIESVKRQANNLMEILHKYSLPMQSLRYQGHMTWDVTLPSIIGYFSAMLQNQNNVTPQASPATTILELLASNDLARMAGFYTNNIDQAATDSDKISAWAHISCDGSVANIESLWAARELKFLPLGIKYALENDPFLADVADVLEVPGHEGKLFTLATAWELLNLEQDDILALPEKITDILMYSEPVESDKEKILAQVWSTLTAKYSLNAKGIQFFYEHFLTPEDIKAPTLIVPSTKHYSWPKAASVMGLGNGQKGIDVDGLTDIQKIAGDGLINVYVDPEGKVDTELLNNVLNVCKQNKKPVIMVVGVMGTTEEGAVDPLEKIIEARESFRANTAEPFEYAIHADAAWGGYFLTCCRNKFQMEGFPQDHEVTKQTTTDTFDNKDSLFRESVYKSMTSICHCDSTTIDPHKMGYIPYPAGSLIYRNDKIINLLTFSAPYINSGGSEGHINTRKIGECGIEGSKSGAAAASVYLSHKVIRPDKSGYGKIINQSMLNSKLFYLYLYSLKFVYPNDKFEIVMFNELEHAPDSNMLKRTLWGNSFDYNNIPENLRQMLRNVAGDQNIVDYIFIDKNNKSLERTTELNTTIFNTLSLQAGEPLIGPDNQPTKDIFVSMTTFLRDDYGGKFIDTLAERVYLEKGVDAIPCIRSVIMDPWAIYTDSGKATVFRNFFSDIFIPKLREVVNTLCETVETSVEAPVTH